MPQQNPTTDKRTFVFSHPFFATWAMKKTLLQIFRWGLKCTITSIKQAVKWKVREYFSWLTSKSEMLRDSPQWPHFRWPFHPTKTVQREAANSGPAEVRRDSKRMGGWVIGFGWLVVFCWHFLLKKSRTFGFPTKNYNHPLVVTTGKGSAPKPITI